MATVGDGLGIVSGTPFSFLHSSVVSLSTPIAVSSDFEICIWTRSCGGISGTLPWLSRCEIKRCVTALYFQTVAGCPEGVGWHRGQWMGMFVQGVVRVEILAEAYCMEL